MLTEKLTAIKGIVFDLDGTLIDTDVVVLKIINEVLQVNNLEPVCLKDIQSVLNDSSRQIIIKAFDLNNKVYNSVDIEKAENLYKIVSAQILPTIDDYYPKVIDGLKLLYKNGFKLSICTNKDGDVTRKIIENNNLLEIFNAIVGANDVVNIKPSKDHLLQAVLEMNLDPAVTIYVGNSIVDQETAANAKINFFATKWGGGENLNMDSTNKIHDFMEFCKKLINEY